MQTSPSANKKINIISRIKKFFTHDVWYVSSDTRGIKKFLMSFLRVFLTTINGIIGKRILVQASSLSYATLLAIGPILAITIIFSGMFFKDKGEEFIYEKIMSVATFVMPAFNEMIPQDSTVASVHSKAGMAAPTQSTNVQQLKKTDGVNELARAKAINPQIFEFINNISKGSSKAGAVGIATMLFTCLLLCINMESAFNFIWGVKKGRKWVDRIVFYFALIFFGSVGTIFGMTFLATSQISGIFKDIPILSDYVSWITYFVGIAVMASVLAFFYKFIPCVRVKWRAAFVGAIIIVLLLVLNNKLSFLYISYIVKQQNFYGYLAIVAVAMFSLYVFWVMILAGGQITYAMQYVDFLSDDESWNNIGARARELCALAVFAVIAKAFYGAKKAPTIESISSHLRISKVIVSACIDWLSAKNYICATESLNPDDDSVFFKPSISPDMVTLGEFFDVICENEGDTTIIQMLSRENPIVASAVSSLEEYSTGVIASKTIRDLIK